MSKLIEQRRARFALKKVKDWKDRSDIDKEKLGAAVNGLPPMILTNGIGQAAAYCKSRGLPHHTSLYEALSDWLCGKGDENIRNPGPVYPNQTDLLAALTAGAMADYRAAQTEALAFLQWLKNAVRAEGG